MSGYHKKYPSLMDEAIRHGAMRRADEAWAEAQRASEELRDKAISDREGITTLIASFGCHPNPEDLAWARGEIAKSKSSPCQPWMVPGSSAVIAPLDPPPVLPDNAHDRAGTAELLSSITSPSGEVHAWGKDGLVRVRAASSVLPEDAADRKELPLVTGCLDYFPNALAAVAALSLMGNKQHNPGQPLHWSRDKSSDHADCLVRHLMERGTVDTDGVRHSVKVVWRALALAQVELEGVLGLPVSRGSR